MLVIYIKKRSLGRSSMLSIFALLAGHCVGLESLQELRARELKYTGQNISTYDRIPISGLKYDVPYDFGFGENEASFTPASGLAAEFAYLQGFNYPYNNFKTFTAASAAECAAACIVNCDFFVWAENVCNLKYLNRHARAGTVFRDQTNGNFAFGAFWTNRPQSLGVVAVTGTQDCMNKCTENPNCHLASFDYEDITDSVVHGVLACEFFRFAPAAGSVLGYRINPNPINVDPTINGRFDVTGNGGVVAIHYTLLPSGKLLLTARPEYSRGGPNVDNIARPELPWGEIASVYDPETGKSIPSLIDDNLFCHSVISLEDGTFFTSGGDDYGSAGPATLGLRNGLNLQRIYYPDTNTWEYLHDMRAPRWYPTNIRLANGDIFIISGTNNGREGAYSQNSLEIYRKGRDVNPLVYIPLLQETGWGTYPIAQLIPGSGNVFMWAGQGWAILDKDTGLQIDGLVNASPYFHGQVFPAGACVLALDPDQNYKADFLLFGGSASNPGALNFPEEITSDRVLRTTIT
jgi:hypothetical protein